VQIAISGEHYEFMQMYPRFIEEAKTDSDKGAEVVFDYANKVEKIHHGLYQKALEAVEGGKQLNDESYFVCQVCGYTVARQAPDKCPICSATPDKFKQVE
jgi:rubrerythrin